MKRIISMTLALSIIFSLSASCVFKESDVEALAFNQPVNRVILEKEQPEKEIIIDEDAYFNDPYYSEQWYISATNSNLVWESLTENNSVVVAVVDTGVDYTHEDLENRVLSDLGYDFVNDDNDAMDDNGHGTHVSGIIAAEANNGIGITGICGDLDVYILPIKVLDSDGSGITENIVSGILYAVEMEADIINLSLGSDVISTDIITAVQTALDANIFVVVASGNDSSLCTPTSLANTEGIFTVSAVNQQDTLAYFSNYGDCVDAYAPGVSILSTYLDNEYAYQDGTSMAAPIVSAAAAIILSQNPDLSIEELSDLLSFSSDTNTIENTMPQTNQTVQNKMFSSFAMMPVQTIIQTPNIIQIPTLPITNVAGNINTTNNNCSSIDIYSALLSLYELV